ncbi:MAG: tyrosine-type recombinase/integrase, partial [Brevinema sp.]
FQKITPENINKFWDELKKQYASDTIRKIACDLKSFLNFAIKQEHFTESQLKKLSFPKITVKVREAIYSEKQWQEIQKLAQDDKDFLLYLQTLYFTGCRPSEIISLHRKDIDNNIRIFQNKTKLKKTIGFLIEKIGFIFQGHDKQAEYYSKKFKKLRLKLGREYSLYTFRHTFATNLLNKTSDIHLVRKL